MIKFLLWPESGEQHIKVMWKECEAEGDSKTGAGWREYEADELGEKRNESTRGHWKAKGVR